MSRITLKLKNTGKSFVKALNSIDKRVILTIVLVLGIQYIYAQASGDFNFEPVKENMKKFIKAFKVVINVGGAGWCMFFIVRIAMAYWGGGDNGREEAGGMIKKLILGIIVWVIADQLVIGMFGIDFNN